jgi:TolB-like protein/Flp pilus assembly protein TadD
VSFLEELKRRNVLRVAAAYAALSWLLIQVAGTLLPVFGLPASAVRGVVIMLAAASVPLLVFTWAFQWTPQGFRRDGALEHGAAVNTRTARRLDRLIMLGLALALAYFAVDKFLLTPAERAVELREAHEEGRSKALVESFGERSIAVLPFVNMSSDAEQEYFSDGLTEELLNLLAKIPELRVIARTSSFAFKGTDLDIEAVAGKLQVAHVLEGSVRRSGNRVRITAQLIRASDSSHLWSETFDRTLEDIFAVQDEIAAAVVQRLKLELISAAPAAVATNPEAYAKVLQARHIGRQGTPEALEQGFELYRQAIELAPGYAPPWDGQARMYMYQADAGQRPTNEGYTLARKAANKALALDPGYARAHGSLGWIALTHDGDLESSARYFSRALALAPGDPFLIGNAAVLSQSLGRTAQAIAMTQYQVARDPANPIAHHSLGNLLVSAGRWDEAIASYDTALSLSPGRINVHAGISRARLMQGDAHGALRSIEQEQNETNALIGRALAQHALGQRAASDAALQSLISAYERELAYNVAFVYAYRNEPDLAFEWLDKALRYQDAGLSEILSQPLFANIHEDPRWPAFLERAGLSRAQLDAIQFEPALPTEP